MYLQSISEIIIIILRFNRVAWGAGKTSGIIAGGLDAGQVLLWDANAITSNKESLLLSKTSHKGPVKGVDFNKLQPHTLATGAADGEVQ